MIFRVFIHSKTRFPNSKIFRDMCVNNENCLPHFSGNELCRESYSSGLIYIYEKYTAHMVCNFMLSTWGIIINKLQFLNR